MLRSAQAAGGVIRLSEGASNDVLVELLGTLPPSAEAVELRYATRTGALLRCDGAIAGAFDREHEDVILPPSPVPRALALSVERRSLPAAGLPSGPGVRWNLMLRGAGRAPERTLRRRALEAASAVAARLGDPSAAGDARGDLALIGHAHLDVAWLWTYGEARRKALRTFATAANLLESDPEFIFTQSQPQLFAFVAEGDAELSSRIEGLARAGRFDASGAALWVEPDCNLPSGESLLRQLAFGMRYAQRAPGNRAERRLAAGFFRLREHAADVARARRRPPLRDGEARLERYGAFPLPAVLVGRPRRQPRPRRVSLAAYEGPLDEPRCLARARARGAARPRIRRRRRRRHGARCSPRRRAPAAGRGSMPGSTCSRNALPICPCTVTNSILEFHRGVATTHHGVKARNAALERALESAEELAAWALVLRASPFFRDEVRAKLREAWEIVLRNQFHDVLTGTSIEAVYDDVRQDYERAERLVAQISESAAGMLPRVPQRPGAGTCPPRAVAGGFRFENGALEATLAADGILADLRVPAARTSSIARTSSRPIATGRASGRHGISTASTARSACRSSQPAARSSTAGSQVALSDRRFSGARPHHARCERAVSARRARARLARAPHARAHRERARSPRSAGPLRDAARHDRTAGRPRARRPSARNSNSARSASRASRPAQGGVALLALDTYGWSLAGDERRVRLGHSLLRGTSWPDPAADRGVQTFDYAYLPLAGALARRTGARMAPLRGAARRRALFLRGSERLGDRRRSPPTTATA